MVWVVERGYQYEGGIPVAAFASADAAEAYIKTSDASASEVGLPDLAGRRRFLSPPEGRVWVIHPLPLEGE